jgi:alkylation response protein AidB-like acyl-CoA dehydrogenase
VIFENCRVPVANRLGPEGDGFKIAMAGLDGGRINIAACSLGGARACLETASRYVVERKQFGKALAEFQATQFKLADMATELDAARLMVWRAASLLDAKSTRGDAVPAPWPSASRPTPASSVVNEALQLHGGYGYLKDYPAGALSARPARAPDPRRHQRDHARDHCAPFVDGMKECPKLKFCSM